MEFENFGRVIIDRLSSIGLPRQTRRFWLSPLLLSVLLAPGCNSEPQLPICNAAFLSAQDCSKLQTIDLGSEISKELYDTVEPLRELLPPKDQNLTIFIHPFVSWNGQPSYIGREVHLFIPQDNPPSLEALKSMVFHESVHSFDMLAKPDKSPTINILNEIRRRILQRKDLSEFYSLLREGSYKPDDPVMSKFGHPQDTPRELYASTLTVLRFYPEQFLNRLSQTAQDQRVLAARYSLNVLGSLSRRSATSVGLDQLPFRPDLVEQLNKYTN